ncbi:MAG: manganese efflux pump [Ruminococcus sp.]|nr:manganese efflux pump [Ruminococcus sp.]
MSYNFLFFFNNVLLGIGLAMDAFSVSLANGLNEPKMRAHKMLTIASTFAFFQALMPLLGWLCVHTVLNQFKVFEKFIPWIALVLLCYIGISMIIDSKKNKDEPEKPKLGALALLLQGIATSIDALSVGFTIADYDFFMALISVLIIGVITLIICLLGLKIGKTFGTSLSRYATTVGGIILILIGLEIFISGIFNIL